MIIVLALATALALIRLGGSAYEYSVIDSAWPKRPELIQPDRGGVSRKRFWIPAHLSFELLLLASLVLAWAHPPVRLLLLIALLSHVAMRVWSAFDFIPRALAFERADPATVEQHDAKHQRHSSSPPSGCHPTVWRLPIMSAKVQCKPVTSPRSRPRRQKWHGARSCSRKGSLG